MLRYTDEDSSEHRDVQKALLTAERLLDNINETIREQEGKERLKAISQHFWIGQGLVVSLLCICPRTHEL